MKCVLKIKVALNLMTSYLEKCLLVWPLLYLAVLLTSVPAAMARTALESAHPKRPTSPAGLPSVLPTLRPLSPATSPVCFHCLITFLQSYFLSVSLVPKGSRTNSCICGHSRVMKLDCFFCYLSFVHWCTSVFLVFFFGRAVFGFPGTAI